MGLTKGKGQSLRRVFLNYIFYLGLSFAILILGNYYLIGVVSVGMYPANHSERIIQGNLTKLQNTTTVTMDLLTPMCSFGVYSEEGNYLYGNFPLKFVETVWDSYCRGKNTIGLAKYIIDIQRDEGVAIISYPLNMQFVRADLRKFLPNAELIIIASFLFQLFTVIMVWSNKLAKRVNRELKKLLSAVEKIEDQDLNFVVATSSIEDINSVLRGIDLMKNSLKTALEEQWFLEQQKKEQVSALAHDVKTPLTIVKGNVGLLKETDMTEEQMNYCTFIEKSCKQIDNYLHKLLSITKEEISQGKSNRTVCVQEVMDSLQKQGLVLGQINSIKVVFNIDIGKDVCLRGNEFELERALLNIIINAVDFSPSGSTITINSFLAGSNQLIIQVIDQGKGFSNRMLKYGKEQFSMEDESRTKPGHHGLGLYIANNIIENYGGELKLSNDKNGGGSVEVRLPSKN